MRLLTLGEIQPFLIDVQGFVCGVTPNSQGCQGSLIYDLKAALRMQGNSKLYIKDSVSENIRVIYFSQSFLPSDGSCFFHTCR